jgi:ATP-binding cassette subfamily B protein
MTEKKKISMFRVFAYGLKFNLRIFPAAFLSLILVNILHGSISGVTTFVTQYFYDSVGGVLTGDGTLRTAYLMIAAVGITLIVRELSNGIDSFLYRYIAEKSRGALAEIMHAKMAKIAPVSLEDTELLDDINRANEGAGMIFPIVSAVMQIFTFFVPYFIVMGFYLNHLKPQFIIALVLVFVPVLAAQLVHTGIIAKFEDIVAPIRREHGFYHQSFTGRAYYKDTRILGAARYFAKEYLVRLRRMNKARVKVTWQQNSLQLATGLLSAAGYAGILFMLVNALLSGEITVGAFAAVFGSIGMLFGAMRGMVQHNIGGMMANMGMAHNFMRFLDLPEQQGEDAVPDYSQGITAERVSFSYPNAAQPSVDDVSLTINAGETVAIVGENGAGKSTLVRRSDN